MDTYNLEEVCNIYQPKTISQDELLSDGEYPVFGANGIIGKYNSYNHEKSEVAVTCRGATCGTVNYTLPKSWITGNAMVVTPKIEKLKRRYLYYFMKSLDYSNIITGSAQPQITRKKLAQIKIGLPEEERQQDIIDNLDAINNIIQTTNDEIKDLKKLINSKFNKLVNNANEYIKLEKICTLKARIGWQGLTKKEYMTTGEYKLITGIDFEDGVINFDKCVFVTKERYDQDTNIQIKAEDILITKDGTIGKVAFVDKIDSPCTLNSGVFVVRTKNNDTRKKYLYYLLQSEYFQNFVDKIKTGATIPHLNQASFYNFEVPLISNNDQDKFLNEASKIEKMIELKKKDLADLKMLLESKFNYYFE